MKLSQKYEAENPPLKNAQDSHASKSVKLIFEIVSNKSAMSMAS